MGLFILIGSLINVLWKKAGKTKSALKFHFSGAYKNKLDAFVCFKM